ncbi:OprO/OprP family phosphate-selective porin [Luteimonas aquatica]|uniref:OprO/OprP family phosphate-selective porin n=1 Tax=Luteimonas aquatica TaxID=450364 RepID=UPI001F55D57C|nr:porin [Luteimonas aquatica]
MQQIRPRVLALVVSLSLSGASLSALAQEAAPLSATEMARLIRAQAAKIDALEQRLAAVERQNAALAAGSAPAPAPTSQAEARQAEVAHAVADTDQQTELAQLRTQVAQLAASGSHSRDVDWRDGSPEFRSADGKFSFRPRGRVVVDASSTRGSAFQARNIGGTEMSQVRLGAEGTIGPFGYKVDADFADDAVSVKDAYLSYDTKAGTLPLEIYVGNKLRDRSIEGATTQTRTPFMERNAVASATSAVNGFYGLGVQAKLFGPSWHVGLSVTGDDIDNAGEESDSVAYTVRAHWNPIKRAQGFVHLGGWYYYENLGDDVVSINRTSRIGLGFNDNLRVSASSIADPTDNRAWGYEVGGVYRSFYGFAEQGERTIRSSSVDSVRHKATSIYGGWMITGEKPGFSARSGVWGTTKVAHPVGEGGWGAFEVALRYDDYDYTDAQRGGEGRAYTLGLNWHLNDWAKLMLDYVHWRTDNKVGDFRGLDTGDTVGVRAQVVF